MRPRKLTMSAFGPYAKETIIDFDELGNNGLYLITGDTGAGKTTIFDAISYALFGEASGDTKEANNFRSNYADDSTPTFVELVFTYNDKEYKIKRNPEYERLKSRGEGTTKQVSSVELFLPSSKVLTKTKEVDEEITNILGINRDQFKQICLISQGDFLKLLLASTKDRMTMFRKIFSTTKFNEYQTKLKDMFSELNAELLETRRGIKQYVDCIKCPESSTYSVDLENIKIGDKPVSEVKELIDKITAEVGKIEKENKIDQEKTQKRVEEINSIITTYKAQESARISLKAAKDAKPILDKNLEDATNKLKDKDLKLEEANKSKESAIKIANILNEYDEHDKNKKDLMDVINKITSLKEYIGNCAESKNKINSEIVEKTKEFDELKDIEVKLESVKNKKKELEQNKKNLDELKEIQEKIIFFLKDIEYKESEFKDALDNHNKLNDDYKVKYNAFLNEQAGIIASTLKDDEPCPVCGSIHHPSKAKISPKAPSKEELETLKEELEKSSKDVNDKSLELASVKEKAKGNQEQFDKKSKEFLGTRKLEDALYELMKNTKVIDDEITSLNIGVIHKGKLDSDIKELNTKIENLKETINNNSVTLAESEQKKKNLEELISKTKSKLTYASKDEASKEIESLNSKANSIEMDLKGKEESLAKVKETIAANEARIAESEKTLKDAIEIDSALLEGEKAGLEAKKLEIENILKNVYSINENNIELKRNIEQVEERESGIQKRLDVIAPLSATANGLISGKEKISLETYVQRTYFKRVLDKANLRLLEMSKGQYELVIREEYSGGAQTGLDLDVIDHYNGTKRNVSTLSGGESFIASLSLALGLSDEVQSTSGGIKLDTMFVDEGFGTLDDDTLDRAMNALMSISSDNKLVGIISHVNELKERIEKQIIVTKSKSNGSEVKIIS